MSDEATHRNIIAIKAYSEDTRKLVRECVEEVNILRDSNRQLIEEITALRGQLSAMQIKVYSGGSTSGS